MLIKNRLITFIGFLLKNIVIIKDNFGDTYHIYIDTKLKAEEYLVEGEKYNVTIKFEQDCRSVGFMYATIIEI